MLVYSIVLLAAFISGCEKNPVDPVNNGFVDPEDPGFFVSFIDGSSIKKVSDELIVFKSDSLTLNSQLIGIKNDLADQSLSQDERIELETNQFAKENQIKENNAKITSAGRSLKALREGKVELNELFVLESAPQKQLKNKSSSIFRFPLLADKEVTAYEIFFNGRTEAETVRVTYNLDLTVKDRIIKRKARNIIVDNHTFLELELDTTRFINETHAIFYY